MSSSFDDAFHDEARVLLCELQNRIRDELVAARDAQGDEFTQNFAEVAHRTAADTIYAIDKVSEATILAWFEAHWPSNQPVELVMEGIEDGEIVTFPRGTRVANTRWKCILDPIDGTRSLMYDKRSAWSLAALAPQKGDDNRLSDLVVAAMTELPTSKAWRADQISGVRGRGRAGVESRAVNVQTGAWQELRLHPSTARDFRHGFAAFARFFPEAKALLALFEEDLWHELYGSDDSASPLVFDDQYICSGGQIYELLVGHDRMLGDLRPLALRKLGLESSLMCHPYDICTAFLLQEIGGIVEAPDGSPLDAPLDTTSPVAWVGYANEELAALVRPLLPRLIKRYFGV